MFALYAPGNEKGAGLREEVPEAAVGFGEEDGFVCAVGVFEGEEFHEAVSVVEVEAALGDDPSRKGDGMAGIPGQVGAADEGVFLEKREVVVHGVEAGKQPEGFPLLVGAFSDGIIGQGGRGQGVAEEGPLLPDGLPVEAFDLP